MWWPLKQRKRDMHVEGHERERGVRRGDIGIFPYLPGDMFIL